MNEFQLTQMLDLMTDVKPADIVQLLRGIREALQPIVPLLPARYRLWGALLLVLIQCMENAVCEDIRDDLAE